MAASADGLSSNKRAPALASVIVLRIREFTRKPVVEQIELKTQLETLVRDAIEPLEPADRAVLDAPDGLAVVVLAKPASALDLAQRAQSAAARLPLCIGVNHGPVRASADDFRGPGMVGDGLASGVTLANVAGPGRFVASRSFREALKAESPARSASLRAAGTYTDANLRTHELFALDRRPALVRRWRLIAYGALAVTAIIGAGFVARVARLALEPPPPPPIRAAIIRLAITPRGDVFIDGVMRGSSPPLREIEVYPGPHAIEVRNSTHPPLRLELNLASGDEMTISHTFAAPKGPAKSPPKSAPKKIAPKDPPKSTPKAKEKPPEGSKTPGDYWRQFRRDIGF
jgi:hypothetical protein